MSNLLEKASIITTPTAYDDGRILSVKPNENIFGSEVITNGDFATNSDWIVGGSWTISGGSANCSGTTSNLDQASLATNTKYKVTVTVSNITTGNLEVRLGSNGANTLSLTKNGTYTGYGVAANDVLRFRSQNSFDGSVDNVSVVEDLSGDFDFERGSAATRVNAQGLVENVQILSSELVQNGNFSEIGSEEVSNGDFSQEGSELITNGNFSVDGTINTGSYALGWYSPDSGLSISNGKLIITNGASVGGRAYGTNGVNGISFLTSGKSYKLVYTITENNDNALVLYHNGGTYVTAPNTVGTHTIYYKADGAIFILRNNTVNTTIKIDNVSVKEVGQDWSLSSTFSIAENKLRCVSDGSYQFAYQNNVFTVGKTYKVTFDILDYVSGSIRVRPGGGAITSINANGSYTLYYTIASGGTQLYVERSGACDMSITNISVKEVGQDWGFTSIEFVGANTFKNTATNGKLEQSYTSIVGAKYRLSFVINSGSWNVVASTVNNTAGIIEQTGTTSNSGTIEFIATTTTTYILLYNIGASGTEASITNISLLQVTDDTDLPRINYEGFSYQDVLGSELVVNGGFDTDSNWNKGTGWSIANGKATVTNSTIDSIYQDILDLNKKYKVTFEITEITSGSLRIGIGVNFGDYFTQVGTYTYSGVPLTDTLLRINPSSGTNASIDNVSVKEITGQEVVPNSGCGSWLFEPQSTNLVTYSEDISNPYWIKLGSSTTSGFTSPSGVGNAYKLVEDTSNGLHWMYSGGITVTNATTYNVSVFAKKGERNSIRIAEKSGISVIVNLESKDFDTISAGVIDSNITEFVDDWIKIDYSFQTTSTSEEIYIYAADNGNINYQGNGSSGIYVWGVQVEQLSYTTSYIPTNGATSTRLQDIANNSGNSTLINSTEGVLYAEIAALANDGINRVITMVNTASTLNRVRLYYTTVDNRVIAEIRNSSGGFLMIYNGLSDATTFNKFAVKYKNNDAALWVNGIEVLTDTSGGVPIGLNSLNFDDGSGSDDFYGKNKALAVFKEALTDTELELLTAPTPEFPTFSLDFDTIAEQFTFTRGSEATFVNEQGLIQSTNELGAELITNGGFDTDSGWIKGNGWSIENGIATLDGTQTSSSSLSSNTMSVVSGKTYKILVNVLSTSSGFRLYDSDGVIDYSLAVGENVFYKTVSSSTYQITPLGLSGTTGSIDNVSVKELTTATNTPRIDYSTGVEAFLLEPQSTNLYPYSQTVTSGGLTFFTGGSATATLTNNYSISPDGTQNALRFQATVLNDISSRVAVRSLLSTSAVMSTVSVYAKSNTNENYTMVFHYEGGVRDAFVVTPEWQRFSFSEISDATNNVGVELRGTYTSLEADVSLWGFQFENQSYATSVIPTDGATATRNQETCVDATPTINSEEGVLYAEISALANDGTFREISLNDGTTNNVVEIRYTTIDNAFEFIVRNANTVQVASSFTLTDATQFNKIAFSYKTDDYKMYVNGVEVASDTSGTMPSGLNKLSFNWGGFNPFFGNTKGLQLFDKALSDYQLKQLTTI